MKKWISVILGVASMAAMSAVIQAHAQSYNIETIAMSGEPAVGTIDTFRSFDLPLLNTDGKVAFLGTLETSSSFDNAGIWTGDLGGLTLVIQDDEGKLRRPQFNDAGSVAFLHFEIGDDIISVGPPGSLSQVAREGDIAPGTGGQLFTALFDPTLNGLGEVAFGGRFDITANIGIWAGDLSNLGLIARNGDIAPDTGGLLFKSLEGSPERFQHSDTGQVAFRATLDTADTQIDQGIWMGGPGQVTLVAREGDEAPGTGGQTFIQVGLPALNSSDQIAFYGEIAIGGGGTENGIWLGSAASPNLVLRPGDDAPGTGGLTFKSFPNGAVSSLSLNASGEIGFTGRIDTADLGTDGAYWAGKGPALALVIREGDVAPGAGGEVFQTFGPPIVLNALGEVAILGGLATFNSTNREGIWVWRAGTLEFITRQTEALEVAPGDTRTVKNLRFAASPFVAGGNDNGLSTGFNDVGQVAFHVEFQDGSQGIFLATPGVVANAGADQTALDNETVVLDGSGSFDPEGASLNYSWTLEGAEIGTGATPTVGPFAAGDYAVTLTVVDADGDTASNVMVLSVALSPNLPPIANAGTDVMATLQNSDTALITLDGSGSSDPDGTIVSYVWSDAGGAEVATGAIANLDLGEGIFTFTLTVTDNRSGTATDDLVVTVTNDPPVANAGDDFTVTFKKGKSTAVTLDGSASSDPNGTIVSYVWSDASGAEVATGATPTLTLGEGTFPFTLAVTDNNGATASDDVVVTLTKGSDKPPKCHPKRGCS